MPLPDTLTADDLALLRTLAHRCQGLQVPPLPGAQRWRDASVRDNWKRWLRYGGGNRWQLLRQRMRAGGLRPACLFLPTPEAAATQALPAWCELLAEALVAARQPVATTNADATADTLVQPLLAVARQRCAQAAGVAATLSPAAQADLQQALAARLAQIAAPVVSVLFAEFRKAHNTPPPPATAALLPAADAPRGVYQAFVAHVHGQGFAPLLARWPVLGRLWAVTVQHWLDMVAEVAQRLQADAAQLPAHLGGGVLPVVQVGVTLGDSHAGGRSVMRLRFTDGLVLAYKPRPTDMESAFGDVLHWLNTHRGSLGHAQRIPRVWSRPGYGWMEWVSPAPMQPGEEPAYHWRLGSLIGLYRALGGIDLHLENAVAAAALPVLIDLECLAHPSAQPFFDTDPEREQAEDGTASALINMAALPSYGFGSDGRIYSYGLFGSGQPQGGPDQLTVRHAGTDWMALVRTPHPVPAHQLAHTADGPVDSRRYAEHAARGYAETLNLVLAHRSHWLDTAQGPLAALSSATGRMLARTSAHYGALLGEALLPAALRDGVAFELTFEALHRHVGTLPAAYRVMAPRERAELQGLDVPRFLFRADSAQLLDAEGRSLDATLAEPPLQRVLRNLQALQPAQVDWEARVLAHALQPPPADRGEVDALAALVLTAPDGGQRWMGLSTGADGTRLKPLTPGLYQGQMGLALALAAAGATQERADVRALAVATLAPLVNDLQRLLDAPPPGDPVALLGVGMDLGIGGLLFGLQAVAPLTGDAALQADSLALARRMRDDPRLRAAIAADRRVDLLNGCTGLLVAALAWQRAEPQAEAARWLALAQACGRHVLQTARSAPGPDGPLLSWPLNGNHGLTGLSHGASGFALALALLDRADPAGPWLDAARAALRYEATLYAADVNNWRDLRQFRGTDPNTVRYFGTGWCHGAPGIALARAALLTLWRDAGDPLLAPLRTDLERAMGATQALLALPMEPGRSDDLCCGTAGRVDVLLECGRLLGRDDWLQAARAHIAQRTQAWAQAGGDASPQYWFRPLGVGGVELGLFKGLSGWPYLRARAADPQRVPCVLLPGVGLF